MSAALVGGSTLVQQRILVPTAGQQARALATPEPLNPAKKPMHASRRQCCSVQTHETQVYSNNKAVRMLGVGLLRGSRAVHSLHSLMAVSSVPKRIGTHSGTFHCDEALGCFLLKQTTKFSGATIVRTRNPEVLATLDAVIDVGGVYDPETDRYDHHQREFDGVFGHGFTTKLSSAGLVYKHYGKEIVATLSGLAQDDPQCHDVYLAIYKNFMEAIDAIDNGINQYDTDAPPRYVNNTHLSSRVGNLNPAWNEGDPTDEELMSRFEAAMTMTGAEFVDTVKYYAKSWLPARSFVLEDLKVRHEVDASGGILLLTRYCPWKSHLYDLEKELGITKPEDQVKYVVYKDNKENKWRVQAVSVSPSSFESRKPLPQAWRGLRDEELSRVTGIPGCVFVHASGFIGGNDTLEGVLQMARAALQS